MRLAVSKLQDPLFFTLSVLGLQVGAATLKFIWVLGIQHRPVLGLQALVH